MCNKWCLNNTGTVLTECFWYISKTFSAPQVKMLDYKASSLKFSICCSRTMNSPIILIIHLLIWGFVFTSYILFYQILITPQISLACHGQTTVPTYCHFLSPRLYVQVKIQAHVLHANDEKPWQMLRLYIKEMSLHVNQSEVDVCLWWSWLVWYIQTTRTALITRYKKNRLLCQTIFVMQAHLKCKNVVVCHQKICKCWYTFCFK